MSYKKISILMVLMLLLLSSRGYPEDIEIFNTDGPSTESNILFLLDQSGSMYNSSIGAGADTRATALQTSFNAVLADPDLTGVNVGLMGFSNGTTEPYVHGVSFPVSPIDDEALPILLSNLLPASLNDGINWGYFTLDEDNLPNPSAGDSVRSYLPQILDSWVGTGPTPIVGALYEAALYYRGATPKWGATSAGQNEAAHPSTYQGTIPSVISSEPTGGSRLCDEPNCGMDCSPYNSRYFCAEGETSCYSGTNCSYGESKANYLCRLGSEAECLLSNAKYESCATPYSFKDCSMTCNGTTDPISGQCLGEEVEVCTVTDAFLCSITTTGTQCDRSRYICKIPEDTVVPTVNASYRSPITKQCQNNAIILLSDGQPNVMTANKAAESQEDIKLLTGSTTDCRDITGQADPKTTFNTLIDGRCGGELAEFLATQDQSSTVDGDNTVKLHTVGFGLSGDPAAEDYLRSLATSGKGKYYSASDTATLVSSFKAIIGDSNMARSFVTPVYPVDTDSLLSHSRDVYLPLFENSHLPAWAGNIKKFKLDAEGKIIDRKGIEAIDTQGVLKPSAIDYWADDLSVTSDSNPVTVGGAASRLDPTNRMLYTNAENTFISLNSSNVSKTLLGSPDMSDSKKAQLIQFITGFEADGVTVRKQMGDILHSKPTLISYSGRQVLFFGTNEGYLHAVDASDSSDTGRGGEELFAFMPDSLLDNIDGLLKDEALTGPLKRIYGVDGAITAWIQDTNNNSQVDSGESAYLFFGLRRGGNEYYALDVSNPDRPSLLWTIKNTGAFSQLGETWSKPVLAKMRYLKSGIETFDNVLVFGGGYDNRLDEVNRSNRTPLSGTYGNAVYIINAKTGELIWSHSGGNLKHSIPGGIRVLDMDRDGSIDRLYFGDTGGNIWRADLNVDFYDDDPSMYDVEDARVYKLAELAGNGADARKFFYEPDVSVFRYKGRYALTVSIGSGYHSKPLSTSISDRFYVLSDENVLNIPETPPLALKESDLVSASALAGEAFMPTYKGWYKDLQKGESEKVLAPAVTFMNKIMFTTFAVTDLVTPTVEVEGCASSAAKKQTSAYVLDLLTASATADLNGDGTVNNGDVSAIIPNGDILGSPQLVFNKPSNCTKKGCNQYVDIRIGKQLRPLVDQSTMAGDIDIGSLLPKVFWVRPNK